MSFFLYFRYCCWPSNIERGTGIRPRIKLERKQKTKKKNKRPCHSISYNHRSPRNPERIDSYMPVNMTRFAGRASKRKASYFQGTGTFTQGIGGPLGQLQLPGKRNSKHSGFGSELVNKATYYCQPSQTANDLGKRALSQTSQLYSYPG